MQPVSRMGQRWIDRIPRSCSWVRLHDRSWFLIVYLLIVTVLTFYVVYSLWSAQPRVAEGRVPATNCVPGASPVLSNLYPEWVNVGSTASDVLILGCGFTTATQVKFNGTLHSALLV